MLSFLSFHIAGVLLGLGLGAILARATSVTDSMVEASSIGLANSLTKDEIANDLLYPRVERIREISAQIAMTVIRSAQKAVSILWNVYDQCSLLISSYD